MWFDAQRAPHGLDDLVNYAALIAPGVLLGKDGSLLTAWHFRGPDLDYASPEEIERLSAQVSAAFTRCSDGWMLHLDLLRLPVTEYLPAGAFPDPTSAVIDEERRRAFHRAGQHVRTVAALTLTYCPPPDRAQRLTAWSRPSVPVNPLRQQTRHFCELGHRMMVHPYSLPVCPVSVVRVNCEFVVAQTH